MTGRLPRRRWIIAVSALVLGAVVGVGSAWLLWDRAEEQAERANEAVAAAEQLCDQVKDLGWTCVQDPGELRGEAGPAGPPGPPPSDEQVAAAVAAYFEAHPVEDGESPSPAAIAAAVTNYLQEHPPEQGEPGPPPTAEQIAAAVEDYLTAHPVSDGEDGAQGPPGPQGPPGEDGEDGHTPTPEEVAAAVETYLQEHPLPTCPAGSSAEPLTVLTTTDGAVDIIACVRQEEEN